MMLTRHDNVHRWTAIFSNSIQGAVTTREGVFHSPHGTVECLSQSYYLEVANPPTTESTRLRMVYAGVGWEHSADKFYDAEGLEILARLFANKVAEEVIVLLAKNSPEVVLAQCLEG